MSSSRAPVLLLAAVAAGCLPDNPTDTDDPTGTAGTTSVEPTEGPASGLFACDSPPCTLVIVSQTLDDRVDVYDADTRGLRGRIALDLKPDPMGTQVMGNLLDEPYELALTSDDLLITLGHWPDTDRGSLLRFPRDVFADLAPGAVFPVDRYFSVNSGMFTDVVQPLTHERQEGIFLLPHPSGRMLIGVFANNIKFPDTWTEPSELLVFDPADLALDAVGSFDLGTLDPPCIGGWRLEPLDAAASKIGVACNGSDSIAILTLPADFATASTADAAAGITGCGAALGGPWDTQFVSPDGAGGMLAIQSAIAQSPRLFHFDSACAQTGIPEPPPAELQDIRPLRQPVLARSASEGAPIWLVATGPASNAVAVIRGGASPALCGRLGGLDILDGENSPWALALNPAGDHLAIGAGPASQPELTAGRGQVLWGALDRSGLDDCAPTLTDVVDLNDGLFSSEPTTWVRAPNFILVAEIGG